MKLILIVFQWGLFWKELLSKQKSFENFLFWRCNRKDNDRKYIKLKLMVAFKET